MERKKEKAKSLNASRTEFHLVLDLVNDKFLFMKYIIEYFI